MAHIAPSPRRPKRSLDSYRVVAIGAIVVVVAVVALVIAIDVGANRVEVALPDPPPATQVPPSPDPEPKPGKEEDPEEALAPELQKLVDEGLPVYCGGGNEPLVALTFDDGPGILTEETVAVLRERGAQATFFLVGKFMKNPSFASIAKDEAKTFELGNHSQNHFGLAGASKQTLKAEIVKPERLIEKETGVRALFFRPPWGSRDNALHRYVKDQGMIEVIWSLDSLDATEGTNTEDILKQLDQNLSAGDIVLMHENRGTTRTAVPEILDMLEEKGLTPVTLSELLTQDPPSNEQLRTGSCS